MTYATPPAAGLAAGSQKAPVRLDRVTQNGTSGEGVRHAPPKLPGTPDPAQAGGRPAARLPTMRRVTIQYLPPGESDPNRSAEVTRIVPSLPAFDEAFAAFARGTLFQTERGPVAVEDLWPGDGLRTVDDGFQPLLWRGSTLIVPRVGGQTRAMGTLTRIAADALGIARPMPDLILGPAARLAHRAPGIAAMTGKPTAFIPARDFIDGDQVIELSPPAAVEVFHLALGGHARLIANGVEVESYHPGSLHATGLRRDLVPLFLSCFPHLPDLETAGPPLLQRLRLHDLDLFRVA